jgi:hypothetical protein
MEMIMRYSFSMGAVVVVLALTACDVGDTPDNTGMKRDHAATNADDRMEGSQDKAYQRLEDRGYRLEQTRKYRM